MPAAAIVGSTIIGGVMQSKAASKAAKAQTKAANQDIAFQKESRDLVLGYQKPYRDASYSATAALMDMTGLSRGTKRAPITIDQPASSVSSKIIDGGRFGRIPITTGKAVAAATPGSDVPDLADYPTYHFQSDPGYAFRLAEGDKAIERSAAAGPGVLSGRYLKSALRYSQDYASNEYQKVYDRIATIAGFGSSASASGTSVIMNTAGNVGNALTNAGDARASSYVAQGNAWSNAINQIGTAYGAGMFGGGRAKPDLVMNYGGPMYGGGLA
jgi:hypothetical protein